MATENPCLLTEGRRAGRRPRPGRRRGGFSLPELLVVLTIVGVIAAVVAPRIEGVRYRMDGAARGAMTALVSAQRQAVQRQHDVVVAFDTSRTRLLLHEDRDNDGDRDADERVRTVVLDDEVRFGLGSAPPRAGDAATVSFDEELDGLPAFRFMRNGSASQEGSFYLTSLRARVQGGHADDTRAIRVERSTGRVEWHQFDDPEWKRGR